MMDGQYFVSALTEKKEGATVLMMAFSFDEGIGIGETLTIGNCFFGPYGIHHSPLRRKSIPEGEKGQQPCAAF